MKSIVKLFAAACVLTTICNAALAQSQSREEIYKTLESRRAEFKVLEEQLLATSEEDRAAYAEFLSQPDTGLIRLLPRETYDGKIVTIRGSGAYYSFTRLTHEYGQGSDLSLEQKYIKVGFAGADYGLMTSLGDVPLDSVTADHEKALIASRLKVPGELPQARIEQQRFGAGTIIEGTSFKDRLPAKVNSTYILRSINYERTDVLVAFRIIRQDMDGSLVIVWKFLGKYPKPQLARSAGDQ
ncbi:MAG TPA: hypothetical protein VN643_14095 [Pyrinomonadaceae bacterium]|nr:hypothetical protein [Pyrinomonadaceae bacterium]